MYGASATRGYAQLGSIWIKHPYLPRSTTRGTITPLPHAARSHGSLLHCNPTDTFRSPDCSEVRGNGSRVFDVSTALRCSRYFPFFFFFTTLVNQGVSRTFSFSMGPLDAICLISLVEPRVRTQQISHTRIRVRCLYPICTLLMTSKDHPSYGMEWDAPTSRGPHHGTRFAAQGGAVRGTSNPPYHPLHFEAVESGEHSIKSCLGPTANETSVYPPTSHR